MRPLVAALFTAAVAATVLAGDGLVLVPHTHALGTPPDHPHGLALYRFPIALIGEPADAPRAANHPSVPSFRMGGTLSETLAGMSLLVTCGLGALYLVALRPLAPWRVAPVPAGGSQWSAATPTGPPRSRSIV